MHDLVIRGGMVVDGTGAAPFVADVAINGGQISTVGTVRGKGREEIDAAGKIVTPGFVDIHTHYDGQATWDQEMGPSSWHGVTTVVMGNCGVGFAPAKPDKHDWLIGLMEGVEDIPGTALAEGMSWDWETFPEYMDALERLPRTVDIGTHVPHGAVRAYVMGERGANNEVPTETDIAQMSRIVEEGLRSGALGFSTSRTVLHKSVDGVLVPGTTATEDELLGIGRAMGRVGHGVFEMASDLKREWNEFDWMGKLSRETGMPVTYAALQSIAKEVSLDEQIQNMRAENARGATIVAQIALRGNGIVMAWQGTVHPFIFKPAWEEIALLPWEQQLEHLQDPAFRQKMIEQESVFPELSDILALYEILTSGWFTFYEMDAGFNYEPGPSETILARSQAAGKSGAEYAYDLLMKDGGKGFIYFPVLNYADGNLDFLEDFENQTPFTDINRDGAHSIFDVIAFLAHGGGGPASPRERRRDRRAFRRVPRCRPPVHVDRPSPAVAAVHQSRALVRRGCRPARHLRDDGLRGRGADAPRGRRARLRTGHAGRRPVADRRWRAGPLAAPGSARR